MRKPIDTLAVAEALRRAREEHPDLFEQLECLEDSRRDCGADRDGEDESPLRWHACRKHNACALCACG